MSYSPCATRGVGGKRLISLSEVRRHAGCVDEDSASGMILGGRTCTVNSVSQRKTETARGNPKVLSRCPAVSTSLASEEEKRFLLLRDGHLCSVYMCDRKQGGAVGGGLALHISPYNARRALE